MVGPMSIASLAGARAFASLAVVVIATLAAAPAFGAAELPDPTRPPTALRRAPGAPAPTVAIKPNAPVLQSVMTGEGRKPSVIINGRSLELGESFDDMKLTRVSETGAVLTGSRGTTTLALTPGADKSFAAIARVERLAATTPVPSTPSMSQGLVIHLPEDK